MEQIAMDEATAHLAEIVDRVRQTGQPVTLTKQGEPYADLVPHRPAAAARQAWAEISAELDAIQKTLPKITHEEIRASIDEGRH